MENKYIYRTVGYLMLIWIGWAIGEYPHIPSFTLGLFRHEQPSIGVYDKCIAATLLIVFATLMIALWDNIWCRISLIFISWGMFNNFIDEMNDKASFLSKNEQISLLLAFLTTTILLWKHRKK